jgi:hypothetical protein
MTTMIETTPRCLPDTFMPREIPECLPSIPARSTEAVPNQESRQAWRVRKQHEGFVITENLESGRFGANVPFRLSGVALNGCNILNGRSSETSASSTRLLSKMLHETISDASVEFIFGGGGGLEFCWRINGWIRDADSEDEAARKAASLRQNLLLVLASEPAIRFQNGDAEKQLVPELNSLHGVSFEAQTLLLNVPQTASLGFANPQPGVTAGNLLVSLPRPSRLTRAFNSVAELVANSPAPIHLSVRLSRFDLTSTQQQQVTDALTWVRRHPTALHRQLADQHLDSSAAGVVETMLKRWVESPQGVKLDCRAVAEENALAPLLAIIGAEVLGGAVNVVDAKSVKETAEPACSGGEDRTGLLSLEGCLPAGVPLPPVFPTLETFSRVRVRRHYNLHSPELDLTGLLLGAITEIGLQSVHLEQTARSRHVYVLGATGTGKSTLLANMIRQDIREGRGVCLIDPHGDLYDQIVESLPLNRAKDVVLFNPGQSDFAPGLNILECSGPSRGRQMNFAINELLKTFDRMYDMRQAGGPMFETYFRNALLLLLESDLPAVTIMELSLVFESKAYRQFLLGRCKNPTVIGFWKDIAEKAGGESALANIAPYITCKLNSFTYNALIRPILGQAESTIDFRSIMDRKGILLIKLPKGILGEFDAQLLGSFILSRIFSVAMSRADVPAYKRHPFHLYVDEFQNFVNDGAAFMLAEARKYGLHLTLANQTLSQLAANAGRQDVMEAVLGNVGSLIAFRVGAPDAEKLRLYTEPEFSALDLQGLPNYHAVARIMTGRGPTRPFIFATLPAKWGCRQKRVNPVVWELRERAHTRPVAEVEAAIVARRDLAKTMGAN